MADRDNLSARVDRLADQRQAKRSSQVEEFVVHTPEQSSATPRRRGKSPMARTRGIGIQVEVERREMEVQTSISLPERVPALWHCQMPKTIIDMSSQEVEARVEDERGDEADGLDSTDIGDDGEVSHTQREALGAPEGDRVDASREATSHPSDDGRSSRNASAAPTISDSDDGSDETNVSKASMVIEDVDMGRSPGQDSVSSTHSYLTDIEDRPESHYPDLTEVDESMRDESADDSMSDEAVGGPSIVKELIGMWDSITDANRWTTGPLYYDDGTPVKGTIDVGRLTYDDTGHDRYGRGLPKPQGPAPYDPSMRDGRKMVNTSGFLDELPQERQQEDDQMLMAVGNEQEERSSRQPRALGSKARKMGTRRLRMARGMTVDSGAADNVIPRRMVRGRLNLIRPSKGSRAGVHYVSASSARIRNEGECDFHFTTKEGQKENYVFQIAEVNKALCAVSYLVDRHNQVIFDQDEETGMDVSRIINKKTGKVIEMTRERNVWTIDAYIDEEADEALDFVRRG